MVSDGESWSGEVQKSMKQAQERDVPLFVVGVGTLAGGRLPEFKDENGDVVNDPEVPTIVPARSRGAAADRRRPAAASTSSSIATAIATSPTRSSTPASGWRRRSALIEQSEDLYWRFLVVAAIFPFLGLLFLRDRAELWILAVGAAAVLIAISSILV